VDPREVPNRGDQPSPTMPARLRGLASRIGEEVLASALAPAQEGARRVLRAELATATADADPEYRAVVEWLDREHAQHLREDLGRLVAELVEERALLELERVRRRRAAESAPAVPAPAWADGERLERFDPPWGPTEAAAALEGLGPEEARQLLLEALHHSESAARNALYLAWIAGGLPAPGGTSLPRADLVQRVRTILPAAEAQEVLRAALTHHRSPTIRARAAHLAEGLR
jgi:hypothetical protein